MPTREEILAEFTAPTPPTANAGSGKLDREDIMAEFISGGVSASPAPVKQNEAEYDRNWYDRPRAALQGMTMGGSDELGSLMTAGLVKGGDALGLTDMAGDESFMDVYNQTLGNVADERKAYETANQAEALALNLGGALLTGGAGANRVLGTQAVKQLPALGKTLATIGTGTVGGGLGGALTADQGERLEGTGTGAALGAAFSMLPMAGKKVFDTASKRRVAQELGEGVDQIPLNLADEGALGEFYRSIVGKSFGGQQKIIDQSAPMMRKVGRTKDIAKGRLDVAKKAQQAAVTRAQRGSLAKSAARTAAAEDIAKASVDAAEAAGEASINKATSAMRKTLIGNAIPDSIPMDEAKLIRAASPDKADALLKKAWTKYGFKSINNKSYEVNADQVKAEFNRVLKDPAMQQAGEGFEDMVDATFQQFGRKNGTISGKALMELRNAMNSIKGTEGRSVLAPKAYNTMSKRLGTLLERGMDAAEKKTFRNDLKKWGGKKALTKSIKNARTTRQGLPNEADVIGASRTRGDVYTGGKGSGQAAAEKVQTVRGNVNDTVSQAKDNAKAVLRQSKAKIQNAQDLRQPIVDRAGGMKLDPYQKNYDTALQQTKAVADATPVDRPSMFERLFATGLTGLGYGASNILTGTGVSRALASPSVQKTIAGQTNTQKTMAEALRRHGDKWNMISAAAGSAAGTQANK